MDWERREYDGPFEDPSEEFEEEVSEEDANRQMALTPAGLELVPGVLAIGKWLRGGPEGEDGPTDLIHDEETEEPLAAFIDGWRSGLTHALAVGPLTIDEMLAQVEGFDREEVEATVAGMRGVGLLSARPSDAPGARYAVTDWLREAVGPAVVSMRSEISKLEVQAAELAESEKFWQEMEIPTAFHPCDVEAIFLLGLPLLELPTELSGVCRLIVDLPESDEGLAGATLHVEGGRVASCSVDLTGEADAWALGGTLAWMDAAIGGEPALLELGGDVELARATLLGLHSRLFKT